MASIIERSLEALAREVPSQYARLVDAIDGLVVSLVIDGVPMTLRSDGVRVRMGGDRAPDVEVRTGRDVILDLAADARSLEEAVFDGTVEAVGDLTDLRRFCEGLHHYLHGAVRGPSFPGLMDAFRRSNQR